MSKKKSFTGSTMTLKDFHGGSIPSDLPLPSAPGVPARPPDRWGPPPNGIRSDTRQRPGSAGGVGTRLGSGFGSVIDERGPPFLSTPENIGRHFDEDERKPFDASAGFTRRIATVSDPVARPATVAGIARSDPNPVLVPVSRAAGAGPTQNAWGVKPVVDSLPPVQSNSAEVLSMRFVQASAIDKVSSGRWQSKPVTPPVEERGRVVDEWKPRPVSNEGRLADEWKTRPVSNEGRAVDEWKTRPVSNEGRFPGRMQLQEQQGMGVDVGERMKMKFLPRMRVMEPDESRVLDEKQV